MPPVLKAYLGQIFNIAEGFLKDANSVTFGINLNKDGISSTLLAEFEPGSYMGKALAGMKNTDASFTAGLPDGKYFVYGGMTMNPEVDHQLLNDFIGPIEAEVKKLARTASRSWITWIRSAITCRRRSRRTLGWWRPRRTPSGSRV